MEKIKKRLVFVVYVPEYDLENDEWEVYRKLIGKVRCMWKNTTLLSGWDYQDSSDGFDYYFTDEEIIDVTSFLNSNEKITKEAISSQSMLYPEHNWENAFLKEDLEG